MELNREQIVKALECCHAQGEGCGSCPYINDHSNCGYLEKNALSLINELTEENERLRGTLEEVTKRIDNLIEKTPIAFDYEKVQSRVDTVRKMQTEIEARCIKGGIYPAFVKRTISQIAEEIIGETK